MAHKKFHLGYFTKFGPPAWRSDSDRNAGGDWWNGEYFADLAVRLEARCVDFMFFEDSANVSRTYKGTIEADVRYAVYTPKNDPVQLLPFLAARTSKIGIIATASTSFYNPYHLARMFGSADGLARGRAGWNIVTSSETDAARNYGMSELPPPAERYDRADEFVDLAKALWDSWEPGAIVRDEETNTYTDPSKVHDVDFVGKWHSSRGPLNSAPSPQGRPILAQAGSSERGREFAAKHADAVFALTGSGPEEMKQLRDDIRARAAAYGRNPDDVKVFWACPVKITDGTSDAGGGYIDSEFERIVVWWSTFFDLDLSPFDLDKPIPEDAPALGHTSMMDQLKRWGRERGLTLRQGLTMLAAGSDEIGLIGTVEQVATNLSNLIDEVGGDGIMIMNNDVGNSAHVDSIIDGLIPELQRRGVMRTEYDGPTLRDNLFAF